MRQSTRIKIAAAATALGLGGLTALGIAVRGHDPGALEQASAIRPEVVHRKEVRRVPVKRSMAEPVSSPAPESAVVGPPATQPAAISDPQPVTSQVSPSGGGGYEDVEGDGEESDSGEGESE